MTRGRDNLKQSVILRPSSVILSEAKNLRLRVDSAKNLDRDPSASPQDDTRRRAQNDTRIIFLLLSFFLLPLPSAYSLPVGEKIVEGKANFERSGTTLNVTASDRSIVEWQSFDIGINEGVNFVLPSSEAFSLSRIGESGMSQIAGQLTVNGNLILVNPNGFHFAPTAEVNAGGLIVSAHDITNSDFLSGEYRFAALENKSSSSRALILNEGLIQTEKMAVLIGDAIRNQGVIEAPLGTIALAAGEAVTVGISQDGLVSVILDEKTAKTVVDKSGNPVTDQIKNTGKLNAEHILLTAESMGEVFRNAINVEGMIEADTVKIGQDSRIEITTSGDIELGRTEFRGNTIIEAGRDIKVRGNIKIDSGLLNLQADSNQDGLGESRIAIGINLIETQTGGIQVLGPFEMYVEPIVFGLSATAREIPSLRTASSAIFEVRPGSFAAVSLGHNLFTQDESGSFVPIEPFGRVEGESFSFNRLAEGAQIEFDLNEPSYTVMKGDYQFTVSFNTAGLGIIEDSNTVAYRLNERTLLRWHVVEGQVVKHIWVEEAGALPDLSFQVASDNLIQELVDNVLFLKDVSGNNIYVTTAPFLTDAILNHLPREVTLIKEGNDYHYQYSLEGLPYPYILDPSLGPNNPSAGAVNSSIGQSTWAGTSNIFSSDDSRAIVTLLCCGQTTSNYLVGTNFGFSIASDSTIDGMVVEWEKLRGAAGQTDLAVRIVKGGSIGTTDKSSADAWPASDAYSSYGGTSDLWGLSWSPSDINASDFGAAIAVTQGGGASPAVDHVRITIYFTSFVTPPKDPDPCTSPGCSPEPPSEDPSDKENLSLTDPNILIGEKQDECDPTLWAAFDSPGADKCRQKMRSQVTVYEGSVYVQCNQSQGAKTDCGIVSEGSTLSNVGFNQKEAKQPKQLNWLDRLRGSRTANRMRKK